MEKILITGGTGFVGSNFVYKFLSLGHKVHLIIRGNSYFGRIESIKDSVILHKVDTLQEREIAECVKKIRPTIILHFATYGAYPGRQKEVQTTIETNVLATINLLNACSEIGFKCFVNTGSSSEYGEKDHPISEEDLPEPNNLYGVSKVASTLYCQYLAKKKDLPVITARLFSPYGYFEDRSRLMPNIIRAALENKEFSAPSPFPVRDFIFIEDVIDAYLKIIKNANSIRGHIFNIGSGVQYSIGEVVAMMEKIVGKKIRVGYGKIITKQHEPKIWVADISKIKKILGWGPKISLEEGLKKNIEWFRYMLDNKNWYA